MALAATGLTHHASAAPGTTVNVNFGSDAGDAMNGTAFVSGNYQQAPSYFSGTTWNDHILPTVIASVDEPGSSITKAGALDSSGAVTSIGYTTASTTTPFDLEGPYTFFDHPNTKMLNGGVVRVWNSGSGNALHNRLTVNGLDPAKVYNIYLASSRTPNVKCSWRIGAAGTEQLIRNTSPTRTSETWRPGDNWTVFYAVAPDAGGNIDVRGVSNAGGDAGAFSGLVLNGFQVVEATGWLNPDKSIYDFGTPETPGTFSVVSDNNTGNNITWTVLNSANVASLAPTFQLADNATSSPVSGSTQDFTSPVNYTVTAQDGSTRIYQITVVSAPPSAAADLLTITSGSSSGAIFGTEVTLYVPAGTDVTALAPDLTVSPFATVLPVSGSTHDFTNPVNYTVTAEDGVSTTIYTVAVVQSNYWIVDESDTWSWPFNWDPQVSPTSSDDTVLVFNTPGTYTSTQDLGDGFELNQLVLGGPALTVAGSSLSFSGTSPKVIQNSASPANLQTAINLSVDTAFLGTGTGMVWSTGVVSGGGMLTKAAGVDLKLSAVNNYTGGTMIDGGTVRPGHQQCFGTGPVTLAGGTLFKQEDLEGNTPAGAFVNPFVLSGGAVSFNVNFGGGKDIWVNSEISGPGSIVVFGAGRAQGLSLQGLNTFEGGLTLGIPNSTDNTNIQLFNNQSLGTGTLRSELKSSSLTSGGLRIAANLSDVPNPIELADGARLVVSTRPDDIGATHNVTFTGPVTGGGSLVKRSSGTMVLAGENSYTGTTRVVGGVLQFASAASLYNATEASWTPQNIRVDNGGALVVNAGGAGELTGAQVEALFTGLSNVDNNGLQNGSSFGVDTTDAVATVTLTVPIVDSVGGGGGTVGWVKSGVGTLQLTGDNSYQGTTTVNGGTLMIGGAGRLGGGIYSSEITLGSGAIFMHSSSSAQTLTGAIFGEGGITQAGPGTLTLDNFSGYTGDTTVSGGTLVVNGVSIDDFVGKLIISGSGKVEATDDEMVDTLFFGGVQQAMGTWGATGSGAEFIDNSRFLGTAGYVEVLSGPVGGSPYATWATSKGLTALNNGADQDADLDGVTNLSEFAFNGDPLGGSDFGRIYPLIADSDFDSPDTAEELIVTVAVRAGTPVFSGSPSPAATHDGITYTIEGGVSLQAFDGTVNVVPTALTTGLPAAGAGYEYRSFSLGGSNGLTGKGFLRAKVTQP